MEARGLQELYEEFADEGLVVLGINTADDREIALEYMGANGFTFPNAYDVSGTAHRVMEQYETLKGSAKSPRSLIPEPKATVGSTK